jgi:hypothetical protein
MKFRLSLALVLAALLLTPSLAKASSAPQPAPAAGPFLAALAAQASCAGAASQTAADLTPTPLFRTAPLPCGPCSGTLCSGKFVGEGCGTSTTTRCEIGPA